MKKTPLHRKARLNPTRRKARPGRLKGADMVALREASYEQHKGLCIFCGNFVPYAHMDLAHRRGKRMHGDSLENVGPAHRDCHRDSHNAGGKPVPKADWRMSNAHGN